MKGNIALYNLSTYYLYYYICSNEICPTLYLYSLWVYVPFKIFMLEWLKFGALLNLTL